MDYVLTIDPLDYATLRIHLITLAEEYYGKEIVPAGFVENDEKLQFVFQSQTLMTEYLVMLVQNFKGTG